MAFTPRTVVYDDELPLPPPKVGAGETFVNRAVNAIPLAGRLTDAISTGVMQGAKALGVGESGVKFTPQAQAELDAMGVERLPESTIPGAVETYRKMRDTRAGRTAAGSQQNPWAGRLGTLTGVGLSLLAPLPKAPGAGVGSSAATGVGYGALGGLTEGKADLTRGEVGQAIEDTVEGGLVGGALGLAGHGLMALGRRGVRALRNARQDTLAQETLAAQEEAARAGAEAAKAGEAERKMVGQAREMNKRFDARSAARAEREAAHAARSEERAQRLLARARQRETPPPDPNTTVLEGMSGKAHQAQQSRTDQALKYQREMGEPDVNTQVAGMRQEYIDRMPEALADPAAARRLYVEKYLRARYPNDPERVARIMSERIGPGGEVLPRQPVAGAAPEAAPGLSLAEEAEAMMAARREALSAPQEQLPLLPSAQPEVLPSMPQGTPYSARVPPQPPAISPMPQQRPGASGMSYGANLRRPLVPEEPPTIPASEPSMAAPVEVPAPPVDTTRATNVPDLRRPPPPTASGPQAVPPAPPALPPAGEAQDVTRLAGPQDVGPLAAERAAGRERGAFGAILHGGYEGVRSGNNTLGAIFGGLRGLSREALKDPAVKARVLAAAKVHLLAQINPEVFAKLGAPLAQAATAGDGRYQAMRYVYARKDPAFRDAEQKAAAEAARLSDEQLMALIAGDGTEQQTAR